MSWPERITVLFIFENIILGVALLLWWAYKGERWNTYDANQVERESAALQRDADFNVNEMRKAGL